jgi:RND family efflux transporter MFP subunit
MAQLTQQEAPPNTAAATPAANPNRARAAWLAILLLVVAGGFSLAKRYSDRRVLARETEKLAIPSVSVVKPITEPSNEELTLPAQLQAYVESAIYSRTNGYLLRWTKDIGSRVKKGELLAEIDTPEIDQELSQAKANRQQIAAQLELAKSSAERWINLRKTDSVSQQEADQQISGYTQAQANLASADANVRRLEQLESFKHIYAPFSGVLTKRNVDTGALIASGNAGQNKELFDVAQVDPLRVYVSVPQTHAAFIHKGMPAYITLREIPGQKFTGKIVRTADVIDPATRTLLTEIDVPNPKGGLMPGSFAEVHFAVTVHTTRISIPVNAILFRPEGPRVAVVGPDQKVHLKAITIGRDFGLKIEVLGGIDASDVLVANPADSLEDGQQVTVNSAGGAHS